MKTTTYPNTYQQRKKMALKVIEDAIEAVVLGIYKPYETHAAAEDIMRHIPYYFKLNYHISI